MPMGQQARLSTILNVGRVMRAATTAKRRETPIVAELAREIMLKLRWPLEPAIAKEAIFRKRAQRGTVFRMEAVRAVAARAVHPRPLPHASLAAHMQPFSTLHQVDIVFAKAITSRKLIQYHHACFVTKVAQSATLKLLQRALNVQFPKLP
jgi:hypothetical protein